ncbi:MAG: hypothetical protein QOH48_52 [Actinomycetota bacterium]|jgi:hypothetical protein|nr:hypothetical protein [Actinomycetota bacterium]
MHQLVVEAAYEHEIVEVRSSSTGPMDNVVRGKEATGSTSREGASIVSEQELSHQPFGDVPGDASDADGVTAWISRHGLEAAVTCKPASELGVQYRAAFDGAPRSVAREVPKIYAQNHVRLFAP